MLTINAAGHPLVARFHGPEDEERSVVVLNPDDYDGFDWGILFFYSRGLYYAIDGASTPAEAGPYVAY